MSKPFKLAEPVQAVRLPAAADPAQAATEWERWRTAAADHGDSELGHGMVAIAANPVARAWLDAIFGNSPYLTRLALREPATVLSVMTGGVAPGLDTADRKSVV